MDKRLEDIVKKNSHKFIEWFTILNSHIELKFSDKDFDTDKEMSITDNAANVLAQISDLFIKYGNFKDKFDNSKMFLNFYGPNLIIKSVKTNTEYNLGIDDNGIYLNTYLKYSDNLKNMDDYFWLELLKLSQYGRFELIEHEWFREETQRKHPELFYKYKGVVFRIFRKYFVDTYENNEIGNLGSLQITWLATEDFHNIITNGCLAFKTLYKINYALWKIEDLRCKKI